MKFDRHSARFVAMFFALVSFTLPEIADARLPKRPVAIKQVAKPGKAKIVKKRLRPDVRPIVHLKAAAEVVEPKVPTAKVLALPVDAVTTYESLESELGVWQDDEEWFSMQKAALSLLGKRYQFGGEGRYGIDCSAFVRTVYNRLNIPLPRTAREQFYVGEQVSLSDLRRGDLLFFRTYRQDASHVGIYVGNDRMIHASSGGKRVMISSIKGEYYRNRFLGARRIVAENDEGEVVVTPPQRRPGSPLIMELEGLQFASAKQPSL